MEELVTRTVEKTIASNSNVATIESTSRGNVSTITFQLVGDSKQTGQVLDDIGGRLAAIDDLPDGAGPVEYIRDFGDTATLMLTVASPKADTAELAVRARAIEKAIEQVRADGLLSSNEEGGARPPASTGVVEGIPQRREGSETHNHYEPPRQQPSAVASPSLAKEGSSFSSDASSQRASLVFCFSPKTAKQVEENVELFMMSLYEAAGGFVMTGELI